MVTTVTILASAPANQLGPAGEAGIQPAQAQRDPIIDLIREKLKKKASDHRVFDMASVEEVGMVLEDACASDNTKPDLVQIIGHGQPGMLSLGYHFTGRYSEGPRGPYYVLDSDPDVYAVLDVPMKPDAEVVLLGCSVAEGSVGPQPLVADGATLVFDLAQMWNCRVSAPTELISADDFDAQGIFKDRGRLLSVKGLEITEPAPGSRVPKTGASKPSIHFTSARCAMAGEAVQVGDNVSNELDGIFDQEIELPDSLALPEICFKVSSDGQEQSAELIGNGRVLRLKLGDKLRHFEARSTELQRLRHLIRELLVPGHKPSVNAPYLATSSRCLRHTSRRS